MQIDMSISEQEIRSLLEEARELRRMGRLTEASHSLAKAQAIIDSSRVEYADQFAADRMPNSGNADANPNC